jgi:hypothetical protein
VTLLSAAPELLVPFVTQIHRTIKIWHLGTLYCLLKLSSFVVGPVHSHQTQALDNYLSLILAALEFFYDLRAVGPAS